MSVLNKLSKWYFKKSSLPYWCILLMDILICYISGLFVFWLYYRGAVTLGNIAILSKTIVTYMIFNLIGFKIFHTYSGIIRYSSFVDLQRVAYAMGLSCFLALVAHYAIYYLPTDFFIRLQGRQIIAMYVVATILMWAVRILIKTVYDVSFNVDGALPSLVYGIKDGGVGIAKNIRNQKPSKYVLKGFISHDNGFKGHLLMGERVFLVNDDLIEYLERTNIKAVFVSPLQNETFRNDQKLQDLLLERGIHIFMWPKSKEWSKGDDLLVNQVKEISVEDLLPRDEIQVNMKKVGEMLTGKRILITGSAGSIGSEMVKQIAIYNPAELMLIDQAETPQHDIRVMMAQKWPNIKTHTVVASIANKDRMRTIFETFKPEYVFHAAAYKHVPMMEDNTSESVQNNIYGTKVIADLSVIYGVKKFVMISTDKAVNPSNVMGCSKRICEIYVQSLDKAIKENRIEIKDNELIKRETATEDGDKRLVTQFVTTRFGNVLGSSGSVIPLFEKQIKSGGPVTVTDPNIIRFFMLIPEACKLVLEAGTHGNGGEIFVFDMGKPVRIADLARRMIRLSGAEDVEIKYTGLRAGEKLYEEVLSNNENTKPSFHEKIRIACVREYDYDEVNKEIAQLIEISNTYDDMKIVGMMKEIVPEYKSLNSKYEVLDKG
jgi:FlaA1/EpsC-like NDP-sugar epimerase